jgi:hypothetical protein
MAIPPVPPDQKNKKEKPNVENLKEEILSLKRELDETRVQREKYCRDSIDLQQEKRNAEAEKNKMNFNIKQLERELARKSSKYSRLSLLRMETLTNSLSRFLVIFTFAIVGPILLLNLWFGIQLSDTLTDVFKIWLGAAIGISTNLLQRNEKTNKESGPVETEKEPEMVTST